MKRFKSFKHQDPKEIIENRKAYESLCNKILSARMVNEWKHLHIMADQEKRIQDALTVLCSSSQVDGAHHKAWVIDQILRTLTGCPTVEKTSRAGKYTYECLGESEE
jgi:hypothetical protein